MLKRTLEQLVYDGICRLDISPVGDIVLESPRFAQHGDYASNVAFALAKPMRLAPAVIATRICDGLNVDEAFSPLATATPLNGFVNLTLKDTALWAQLVELGSSPFVFEPSRHRVLVEYVSANPTGPLHIGHGRWAVIGSTLVQLLRYVGQTVDAEFYINDAGNQIKLFYQSVEAARLNAPIPENGYHGAYILDLAREDSDPLTAMLSHQRGILARVGAKFDTWFSEKSLIDSHAVDSAISHMRGLGFIDEVDGAVWFKSTLFGDDKDRVIIKADGTYSYFASDIAYHFTKINRGYTRLINIFGADHHGYVGRITACVQAFMGDRFVPSESFCVIIGQLVNLFREGQPVRMSKRTGEMITLEEVVDEIGVDATRYFLLEKSPDTPLDFDLSLAMSQSSDNPVFYVQYAHARICRILAKLEAPPETPPYTPTLLFSDYSPTDKLDVNERQLILAILRFEETVWYSASLMAPHKLVHYVHDLARAFHLFYETCPILKADTLDQKRRVVILNRLRFVFGECLDILGISAPQSM